MPRSAPLSARWLSLFGLGLAMLAAGAQAQPEKDAEAPSRSHSFRPSKLEPSDATLAQIKLPPGFGISVFARGLKSARMLVVSPEGRVYVSRPDSGDVLMLEDRNLDGVADPPVRIILQRPGAHGLAIRDGMLYVATAKEVLVAPFRPDGSVGEPTLLIRDLPDPGQHANRTLSFGPDGMLYISVGSTCNACAEKSPESATLLRATPDGKTRSIFASGLRNTMGFDWHPATGELWGMDHGIDHLGDDLPPEELNLLEQGKQYGWPHAWGNRRENPLSEAPVGMSKAQWRARSQAMTLGYTAHAAPIQMLFVRGSGFPPDYSGDALVSMHGSWNRSRPSGYEIVRIRFDRGRPQRFEPFVTGFLQEQGRAYVARPTGLAWTRDGALLVADDANGVIYRVVYQGREPSAKGSPR